MYILITQVQKPRDRAMESVDVSILLEMLGPDNVIVLFSTILLERSVILVSRQLTGTEALLIALLVGSCTLRLLNRCLKSSQHRVELGLTSHLHDYYTPHFREY